MLTGGWPAAARDLTTRARGSRHWTLSRPLFSVRGINGAIEILVEIRIGRAQGFGSTGLPTDLRVGARIFLAVVAVPRSRTGILERSLSRPLRTRCQWLLLLGLLLGALLKGLLE
jgi:hypothetical protein